MRKLLIVPGPGNIPEDVLQVFGEDVIHHRTPDFQMVYRSIHRKLKDVFQTEQDVAIVSTSGTGGMEASVVNLFSPGDKVLVINAGTFGDRYRQICEAYSLTVLTLDYEWGTTYTLSDVRECIAINPDLKGILVTYNETSTGVLHNVSAIGKLTSKTDVLLVVDANSGLLANEFLFDDWGVDCAVGCSQKGFCLPTGLSFIAMSKKALNVMKSSQLPKFFFDLGKYLNNYREFGYTPFSPNTSVIRAADVALTKLLSKGLPMIRREQGELRAHTAKRIRKMGLRVFSDDKTCSHSGIVVDLCGRTSMKEMKEYFDKEHDITLSLGKNQYEDRAWRIGLLPPMTINKIDWVLDLVEEYISSRI